MTTDHRHTRDAALERLLEAAKFAANCPAVHDPASRRTLRSAIETYEYHRDRAREEQDKWEEDEQTRDLAEMEKEAKHFED